jgi:hypothetical protein
VCEGQLNQVDLTKKPSSPSCTSTVIASSTNLIIPIYVLLFNDIVLWTQRVRDRNSKDYFRLLEPPSRITHVEDMPDRKGMRSELVRRQTVVRIGLRNQEPVLQGCTIYSNARLFITGNPSSCCRQHMPRARQNGWTLYVRC